MRLDEVLRLIFRLLWFKGFFWFLTLLLWNGSIALIFFFIWLDGLLFFFFFVFRDRGSDFFSGDRCNWSLFFWRIFFIFALNFHNIEYLLSIFLAHQLHIPALAALLKLCTLRLTHRLHITFFLTDLFLFVNPRDLLVDGYFNQVLPLSLR